MKNYAVILIVLLLAACAPSAQAIQTAIAQTETKNALLNPTATMTFTPSPSSTNTPTPTETPTLTDTYTPTVTYTPTPTSTPLPPAMLTATAYKSTLTEIANNATQTVEAKAATETVLAQYKDIDKRELISYAENHKGEKVKVNIMVFNIVSTEELQGYFIGTYDAIYIRMTDSFSGIYQYDYITVYGIVGGKYCFANAMGAQICQPLIEDAFYTRRSLPPQHPAGTTGQCKDGTYTSADTWQTNLCKNHGGLILWWGG